MDSDDLWYEVGQLATLGFWRDIAAAWLVVGAVFVLLFVR